MTSTSIVQATATDTVAERRLTAARTALTAAMEREEHVRGVVASHGGLDRCGDHLVTSRMLASAHVGVARIDVERWEQRAAEARA